MRADSISYARSAAQFIDISLSGKQQTSLDVYHRWLAKEAMAAGGIGPNELVRLWQRHIADALLFGVDLKADETCIDVGTGVGLPGIPLAIAFPETRFTLLDRSGRRALLARRAVAVLGLDNCEVVEDDVAQTEQRFDRVVSRASLPPQDMMIHVKHLLAPAGSAIIGLSRREESPQIQQEHEGLRVSVIAIPFEVLDSVATLLRIVAT